MALLRVEGLSKRFGAVAAVDDVTLDIEQGEFFALLGPSGCGKTTLLRMIAGLEVPSAGRILLDGEDVTALPPNRRPVNMVFQSYAIFPHMDVAANVGYGLRVAGVAAAERGRRVADALALVRLDGLGGRLPDQLSGGQRQRVALARALVLRPRLLLLDEPLSALDAQLREAVRGELAAIQAEVGVTFVLVTHDQAEALALATRAAVMDRGRIAQVGTPAELYDRPANRFVAGFIGRVNLFAGRVEAGARIACDSLGVVEVQPLDLPAGTAVTVALRPERIEMAHAAKRPTGRVTRAAYQGSGTLYEVALAGGGAIQAFRSGVLPPFQIGDEVALEWDRDAPVVLRD